ncbi:MAG: hypothetical protein PQJ46_04985 [Spirochaetales bacterium]|nr:hypothetical protein [Spirochaetales bacterium]
MFLKQNVENIIALLIIPSWDTESSAPLQWMVIYHMRLNVFFLLSMVLWI